MLMNGTAMAGTALKRGGMCRTIEGSGGSCGIYRPSDAETDRYRRHGMAMLRFADMAPRPSGNARIDVGPLLEVVGREGTNPKVGRPTEAWVRRGEAPVIIISAGAQHEGSKSHVKIDAGRELAFVQFGYCPKARGNTVLLEPIYRQAVKEV
jgi:hypothetical protein